MWRARLSRAIDWIRSRRLVGEDAHHMYYAEYMGKGAAERRYVEYKDNNITHASDRMCTEWWAWLHSRRDTAPTAEELERSARNKRALAQRVAALEEEDEKQRLRQFSGSVPSAASPGDKRHERQKARLLQSAKTSSIRDSVSKESVNNKKGSDTRGPAQESNSTEEDYQPESWEPASTRWRR